MSSMNRSQAGVAVSTPLGFSTLSVMISITLLGLVLAPLLGTVLGGQRSFVKSWERAQASSSARYAHLALTRMMRISGSHPVGGIIDGIDPDPEAHGVFDNIRVRADYNPPDGDILDSGEDVTFFLRGDTMITRWGAGAPEEPYLIGVDSLAFEYFERDGTPITDPALVTSRAASARVTIRTKGETTATQRTLVGRVRLRNSRY